MNSARDFTRAAFTKWLGMHDMTDRGRDPEITDPRDPYKQRDVVAELDRWLALGYSAPATHALLQAARDEIVALREMREAEFRMLSTNRDEVLEVAAHECDEEAKGSSEGFRDGCETCAAAIRALREKRDG